MLRETSKGKTNSISYYNLTLNKYSQYYSIPSISLKNSIWKIQLNQNIID